MTLTMLPNGRQTLQTGDVTVPFAGNGKIDEQTESGGIVLDVRPVSIHLQKPF